MGVVRAGDPQLFAASEVMSGAAGTSVRSCFSVITGAATISAPGWVPAEGFVLNPLFGSMSMTCAGHHKGMLAYARL